MMRALILLLGLILASGVGQAAPATQVAAQALPISVNIEPQFGDAFARQLQGILQTALTLVQMFPPAGYANNEFSWQKDRAILRGKTLTIAFASKKSDFVAPILTSGNVTNLDAFTMAPMNITEQKLPIYVVILVDEIFYDQAGHERPDGFSRLVVALAHEIYGNVQHFLDFDLATARVQTAADRVKQERAAFRASVLFLGGMISSPKFATLPPRTRAGLLGRLPYEISAYESWQHANPSDQPDPTCEAILRSLKAESPATEPKE